MMGCQIMSLTKAKMLFVLSVWGVIMLLLLGGAFKLRAPGLYDDININFNDYNVYSNKTLVYEAYDVSANNCFITAGMYMFTLLLSLWQWKVGNSIANRTIIQ